MDMNFAIQTLWDLDIEKDKVQGSFILKQDQEVLVKRVGVIMQAFYRQ